MDKTAQIEKKLRTKLRSLFERAGVIEGELRTELDADWSEQATELEDDSALEGIDDVLLEEIYETRRALARLRDGTYGICARCGEPISEQRLAALPTAIYCIACAEELEKA